MTNVIELAPTLKEWQANIMGITFTVLAILIAIIDLVIKLI